MRCDRVSPVLKGESSDMFKMEDEMRIITISREFGSGGRTIGKQTAELLGIPYYDKELVKTVALQTGFEESFVEEEGEHAPAKNWLSYALAINGRNGGGTVSYTHLNAHYLLYVIYCSIRLFCCK